LTARGADRAAEVLSAGAAELRRRTSGVDLRPQWAGVLVVYAVVLALCGSAVYGWLLGHQTSWADEFVPNQATALESFNQIDERLIQLVDDEGLHDALVLVQGDCQSWQCYGSVAWLNTPKLDGDIVYARDLPERRGDLFAAYPDRLVYTAQYTGSTSISPFGRPGPVVIQNGQSNAPRARDIHVPTPTPTAEPNIPDAADRDQQRVADLNTIAGALQDYYRIHGFFPLAEGLQSFCRYRELDAGCKVTEVLDPLPNDPDSTRTYYYLSNGDSFTVWVQTDGPAPQSNCPESVAKPGPKHIFCVQGKPPA